MLAWLESLRACGFWLAATEEALGDLGRGDSVACFGNRRMHVGIPSHRRPSAASLAGAQSGPALLSFAPGPQL